MIMTEKCTCIERHGRICCRLKSWQVPQPERWAKIAQNMIEKLKPICRLNSINHVDQ